MGAAGGRGGMAVLGWMLVLGLRMPKNTTEWVIVGGVFTLTIGAMVIGNLRHRKRRKRLAEGTAALGLAAVDLGSSDAGYCHRESKGERSFDLKLCAAGELWGRPARVAEYAYETGRGKHSRTWVNLQVSLGADPAWPEMLIRPRPGIMRRPLGELLGGRAVKTGDAEFDGRWDVVISDPQVLGGFLSPAAKAVLMAAPKHESWLIEGGWISLTWRKACGVAELRQMVERMHAMTRALEA